MTDDPGNEESLQNRAAFRLGVYVQGLVLGILLFIALCELFAAVGGIRVFRYQAF